MVARDCARGNADRSRIAETAASIRIRARFYKMGPPRRSSMLRRVTLAFAIVITAVIGIQGQTRRPLAIEDYYRVLTVTNPQIADDGKTVRFSVTTRVESDNSTKTETFTIPTDGSAAPTKVDAAPAGRGGRAGGAGSRVTSPDGRWIAR